MSRLPRPSSKNREKKKQTASGKPGFRPLAGGLAPGESRDAGGRQKQKDARAERVRRRLPKDRAPSMHAPVMLELPSFEDYALLDSGFERKLERYGPYRIVRPEGQALWQPRLDAGVWAEADAIFSGDGDEDASGRWKFQNKLEGAALEDVWPLSFGPVTFHGRFTAFRHVGFFPEQAAHWQWFDDLIQKRRARTPDTKPKVLNLFGYTGVASLVAAAAGAEVTHIDASKKAIGWARQNQELSGLSDKPIRWICDDALKFVEREARRGSRYDGIVMDPPKYGRGPKGEVWQFFEDIDDLMHKTRALLSDTPLFFLISSYAVRASFMATHELGRDVFAGLGGVVESGELLIREEASERCISTSLFTRWATGDGDV